MIGRGDWYLRARPNNQPLRRRRRAPPPRRRSTLIHPRIVMTAAHCFLKTDGGRQPTWNPAGVRVGQHMQEGQPAGAFDSRRGIDTLVHPKYKPVDYAGGWDIALVLLDKPSTQQPARLPEHIGARACARGLAAGACHGMRVMPGAWGAPRAHPTPRPSLPLPQPSPSCRRRWARSFGCWAGAPPASSAPSAATCCRRRRCACSRPPRARPSTQRWVQSRAAARACLLAKGVQQSCRCAHAVACRGRAPPLTPRPRCPCALLLLLLLPRRASLATLQATQTSAPATAPLTWTTSAPATAVRLHSAEHSAGPGAVGSCGPARRRLPARLTTLALLPSMSVCRRPAVLQGGGCGQRPGAGHHLLRAGLRPEPRLGGAGCAGRQQQQGRCSSCSGAGHAGTYGWGWQHELTSAPAALPSPSCRRVH